MCGIYIHYYFTQYKQICERIVQRYKSAHASGRLYVIIKYFQHVLVLCLGVTRSVVFSCVRKSHKRKKFDRSDYSSEKCSEMNH